MKKVNKNYILLNIMGIPSINVITMDLNETIVSKPGNVSFQPSDVAVDSNAKRIFVSVEGDEDIYGALFSYKLDGTDEKVLKTNLNRPYGLC